MTISLDAFRQFTPPGPVAAAFLQDRKHDVRALLGPVGGGKSVTCVFDLLRNAAMMPVCRDGKIHFRVAVIGMTYGQMERNLFPTWKSWIPPNDQAPWQEGEFTGGGGRFAKHEFTFDIVREGKYVQVLFEAIFAAIGENNAEQFMRGFEPTAFWLYEVDLLPEDVLIQAQFRLGRFPAVKDLPEGVSFRSFIIGDLNAPDIDSWFYKTFEEDRPEGHKLYRQPSGRSAQAENRSNLPKDYYERQVRTLSAKRRGKHLVRRFVDAQYGPSLAGEPVYDDYSDQVHLSTAPLAILPGVPILAGFDQGIRWPAAVLLQQSSSGQYRVIGEVSPGRMGAKRFAERVRNFLAERAPGCAIEAAWADPAGWSGADREVGETAWAETLGAELGITIEPAPTNEFNPRVDAVTDELTYMLDGQSPGLILDGKHCPMLRKGFASHYMFPLNQAGEAQSDKRPVKNEYSHVHDALQYIMIGHKGRYGAVVSQRASDRRERENAPAAPAVIQQTFHPFARR